MPAQAPTAPATPGSTILTPRYAAARMALLAELQTALTGLGVQCVLARRHRLVLRYTDKPVSPSGLTDPTLHVFALGGTHTVSTDGTTYRPSAGEEIPADDPPAVAAALICIWQPADQPDKAPTPPPTAPV